MRHNSSQSPRALRFTFFGLFVFGILLRIAYTLVTPFDVRGHDYDGHIEYIQYLSNHWSLPIPTGYNIAYHPPLYYLTAAPLYQLGLWLGWSTDVSLRIVQWESLLLSAGTLWILLCVGRSLLWNTSKALTSLLLYGGLIATVPCLIFLAPRINNDVLYTLLGALCILLLLRWWQNPQLGRWVMLSLFLGLALLTKSNAFLLIGATCLCALLQPSLPATSRLLNVLRCGMIVLIVAGWFVIPRALSQPDVESILVGNVHKLTNVVPTHWQSLVAFNPIDILRNPYLNPFDLDRSQYFWPCLFQSAFTGEWNFGARYILPTRILLFCGLLLLLPVILVSMVRVYKVQPRYATPLIILTVVIILGHFFYRIFYPFSSSQDFRYSILFLPLLALFIAHNNTKVISAILLLLVFLMMGSSSYVILGLAVVGAN